MHSAHTVLSPSFEMVGKSLEGWGLIGDAVGTPEIVHLLKIDFPTNRDGNRGGFKVTCDTNNGESENSDVAGDNFTCTENYMLTDVRGDFAGTHDRRIYRKEFAKY